MTITIKNDFSRLNVPTVEDDKELLGLENQYPIGYLAGSTVREAILHDPQFVFRAQDTGKIRLKGDAITFLFKFIDPKGKKLVAKGKKGF